MHLVWQIVLALLIPAGILLVLMYKFAKWAKSGDYDG